MLDTKINSLLTVVEEGNYSKAARKLNLTQPAVSQHIRALEDSLSVKIFERIGNRLRLTEEGEAVIRYARQMRALDMNLKQELAGHISGVKTLNVGITHTMESNNIAEVLARFASERPSIRLALMTDTKEALTEKVRNFALDFAILDGTVFAPDLVIRTVDTDRLMLIVAPEHPLARKSFVTTEELKKEKLILRPPHSATSDLFTASLESSGLSIDEFRVILEVDNIATIKDLIRHGYGVSVLAKSACMDELGKGKIIALPIENLSMERAVSIVYSPGFRREELLEDILKIYNEM